MLRHSEQWRFRVFWQDDGGTSDAGGYGGQGYGGGTTVGYNSSIGTYATSPKGTVSVTHGDATDATGGGGGGAAVGPSGIGAPSGAGAATGGGSGAAARGGSGGGGGVAGGVSGAGAATGGGSGAATGGGGGTAAGGSASGPGGAGGPGGLASNVGLRGTPNFLNNILNSFLSTPANAGSLYGDSGSAAAYMDPAQIHALNHQLRQGQPSSSAFGDVSVAPALAALAAQLFGPTGQDTNMASTSPSMMGVPTGNFGMNMGFPALEGVSPGITAAPAGPSPSQTVAQQNAAQQMANVEAMAQNDMGFAALDSPAMQTATDQSTAPTDQTTNPVTQAPSPQDSLMAIIASLITGQPPLGQLAQALGNWRYG